FFVDLSRPAAKCFEPAPRFVRRLAPLTDRAQQQHLGVPSRRALLVAEFGNALPVGHAAQRDASSASTPSPCRFGAESGTAQRARTNPWITAGLPPRSVVLEGHRVRR